MFGFLRPPRPSAGYRRAYARLCQHQRFAHGLPSLAFHSYEAVFLFQAAGEAGAFPTSCLPDQRCCRLRSGVPASRGPDAPAGRLCSAVALLLGSVKLEDDIRDAGGLVARLARWLLRRRFDAAGRHLARLDAGFADRVRWHVADHHALEAAGGHPALVEYARPSARAFAETFALAARLPGVEGRESLFARLGTHVGTAIIAYDCAVDWRRDRARGEFNPLPDAEAVGDALHLARVELRAAEVLARRELGASCETAATLSGVRDRLTRVDPLAPVCATRPAHRPALALAAALPAAWTAGAVLLARKRTLEEGLPPEAPAEEKRDGGCCDVFEVGCEGCGCCGESCGGCDCNCG